MTMQSKNKIYKALDVAKYFIYLASQKVIGDNQEKEGVTNLKIQKLLYLAQAYYLAKLHKPLFGDQIEAWEFGPVIPSVYKNLKKYGRKSITVEEDKTKIFTEDKENLKKIWDAFGGYSASRLVDITHAHTPWKEAYKSDNKEISNKAIGEYYTPLLNN